MQTAVFFSPTISWMAKLRVAYHFQIISDGVGISLISSDFKSHALLLNTILKRKAIHMFNLLGE